MWRIGPILPQLWNFQDLHSQSPNDSEINACTKYNNKQFLSLENSIIISKLRLLPFNPYLDSVSLLFGLDVDLALA